MFSFWTDLFGIPCCSPLLQSPAAVPCCSPLLQFPAAVLCCSPLLQSPAAVSRPCPALGRVLPWAVSRCGPRSAVGCVLLRAVSYPRPCPTGEFLPMVFCIRSIIMMITKPCSMRYANDEILDALMHTHTNACIYIRTFVCTYSLNICTLSI